MATSVLPISSAAACGLPGVEVGDHDAGAFGGQPGGDRLADPGGGAGDQGDPGASGLGFGIRASFASSSAQYSILNFSDSSIGAYVDRPSAPRITLIALR